MPRRAARVDENQSTIVSALRAVGATVTPTHAAGEGFPDLCVGYQGSNYLLEVKDGNKPPSKRRLTDPQIEWHRDWRGQRAVVNNATEALEAIGVPFRGVIS